MKYINVIFIIFLLGGCTSSSKEQYTEYQSGSPEKVSMQVIPIGGEYLLYSDKLLVYKDFLLNINSKSDKHFEIFDLTNLKYIGACGEKGSGPNEFKLINTKCCGVYKDLFYIIEPGKCTLSEIYLDQDSVFLRKQQSITLTPEFNVSNSLIFFNDTTLILNSSNENYTEFCRYNSKNESAKPINKYSNFHSETNVIPSNATGTIYLSKTFWNDKSQKMAALYSYYPMLKTYTPSADLFHSSILEGWNKQTFDYIDGGININNSYIYYLDACASDAYIYGLYIGEKTSDISKRNPQDIRPELHIWNWEGELIKTLELDKFVNKIAVDKSNTIYATAFMIADSVYKLNVNKLIP